MDNGVVLLALKLEPGFRSFQSFLALIQLLLDLHVLLMELKVFMSDLRSLSDIRHNLLSFSKYA